MPNLRDLPIYSLLPPYVRMALLPVLVATVVSVAGYLYYQSEIEERDRQVSALLARLADRVGNSDVEGARPLRDEVVGIGVGDQLTLAYLLLAAGYHKADRFAEAAEEYEAALLSSELMSLRDLVRLRLALTMIELDNLEYARALLEAVETKSDTFTALVEDRYGDIYRDAGNIELATESYARAAKLANDRRLTDLAELMLQKIALMRTVELLRTSQENAKASLPEPGAPDKPELPDGTSVTGADLPAKTISPPEAKSSGQTSATSEKDTN